MIPEGPLQRKNEDDSFALVFRGSSVRPLYEALEGGVEVFVDSRFHPEEDWPELEPVSVYGRLVGDGDLDPSDLKITVGGTEDGFILRVEIFHRLVEGTCALIDFSVELLEDMFVPIASSLAGVIKSPFLLSRIDFFGMNVQHEYNRYRSDATDLGIQILKAKVAGALMDGSTRRSVSAFVRLQAEALKIEVTYRLRDQIFGYVPYGPNSRDITSSVVVSAILRALGPN